MGTRNLTIIQLNGKYVLAQYGQWDGQPDGQGATVLEFLHTQAHTNPAFAEKLLALKWITDAEAEVISKKHPDDWARVYPQMTRDTGAEILDIIYKAEPGLLVHPSKSLDIEFAGESLQCEWAYVIDLDKQTFEVFQGFNKEPVEQGARFSEMKTSDHSFGGYEGEPKYHYYQVKLSKEWPLHSLPTMEEFLAAFAEPEEDEGEE